MKDLVAEKIANEIKLSFAGQQLCLTTGRALFWYEQRALILSDLHLGKDETFRHHGIPIPAAVGRTDLDELLALYRRFRPARIIIAGDFLHHPNGYNPDLVALFQEYREQLDCQLTVVTGNHENSFRRLPKMWQIEYLPDHYELGPLRFIHDQNEAHEQRLDRLTITGHLHPILKIKTGINAARLPCYLLNGGYLTLPAFTKFSRGYALRGSEQAGAYGVVKGEVLTPDEFRQLQTSLLA